MYEVSPTYELRVHYIIMSPQNASSINRCRWWGGQRDVFWKVVHVSSSSPTVPPVSPEYPLQSIPESRSSDCKGHKDVNGISLCKTYNHSRILQGQASCQAAISSNRPVNSSSWWDVIFFWPEYSILLSARTEQWLNVLGIRKIYNIFSSTYK